MEAAVKGAVVVYLYIYIPPKKGNQLELRTEFPNLMILGDTLVM
jgi:hypothetical protein